MDVPKRVLIVEDDPTSLELAAAYFEAEGFRVLRAGNGAEMQVALRKFAVDLLCLDLRLPGQGGLSLLRELRRTSDLPVIVISAKTDDIDRIVALEMGADDYVDKPYNPRELLARANNILRRVGRTPRAEADDDDRFHFRGWTIDPAARRLTAPEGTDVHLTRGEFELLVALVRNRGRVLQRDTLLGTLSGRERDPFDRTIDVLVGRLRKKIERDPKDPELIITIHGIGYVFVDHAEENEDNSARQPAY
ncbi:response regulator transcription factor [Tropicimonas isoalkanivorans]|uniref:Regulatory protein VirG n=1 Tax=Tropicimonas isoalkanivorans TaxID=441112 RepID=A0A1I1KN35_9RHOB|nr:response regulator transcription factor [Tropicimonas isoalkanivorans]SFC62334.1 two component transcriptional regulator, winged helix family [Tropicimonas isoalkanivorans]